MWLLNTATGRLTFFSDPEDVLGGYAILSHVWGKASEEDTFQKVQEAARKCNEDTEHAGSETSCTSVEEDIARQRLQKDHLDQLRRRFEALLTRREQLLSGEPMPSEETRPSKSTAVMPSGAMVGGPRDLLSSKIRNFLRQAEARGFEWAWASAAEAHPTISTTVLRSLARPVSVLDEGLHSEST